MEDIKFKLEIECTLTQQNINDLMTTALEGGINYWCGDVEVLNIQPEDEGKLKADCLSLGYDLKLSDVEDDSDFWVLTLLRFVEGIKKEMINAGYYSVEDLINYHDAGTTDNIVQFALFDKLIFD